MEWPLYKNILLRWINIPSFFCFFMVCWFVRWFTLNKITYSDNYTLSRSNNEWILTCNNKSSHINWAMLHKWELNGPLSTIITHINDSIFWRQKWPYFIADIFPPTKGQNRSFIVFTVTFSLQFKPDRHVNRQWGKGILGIKHRNKKRQNMPQL